MNLADPVKQPQFYASVAPKRFVAWIIDTVLIVILCAIIVPFTAFTGLFFLPFLFLVVGFLYRVVTIRSGSATWGMRFMSIEFRSIDGGRFDLSLAFWHTVGFTISWSVFPLQLISVASMLISERGQGLSDHLLGTTVLNRRA
ncbi:MAG: RDD family protein [Paracoccaceae bacterium]